MTSTDERAGAADREYDELARREGSKLSRWGMIGGTAAIITMIVVWTYVFVRGPGVDHRDQIVSTKTREEYVDYSGDVPEYRADPPLSDATPDEQASIEFIVGAERACQTMVTKIDGLDNASQVQSFSERANLIEQGSQYVEQMLDQVQALPRPTDPENAKIVGDWIDDYYVYVGDRNSYAEEVRGGHDGPFTVSASNYVPERVTDLLTTFAEVNAMYSCVPPEDV